MYTAGILEINNFLSNYKDLKQLIKGLLTIGFP